jgi:hypothetical protein
VGLLTARLPRDGLAGSNRSNSAEGLERELWIYFGRFQY